MAVCRPAVEWLAAQLPAGGTGYERPEWTGEARAELVTTFFTSDHGAPLAGDPDAVELLGIIVRFACDAGPGDPLRWTPAVCEALLVDWVPHTIVAPLARLAGLPALLRRFVAYAHRQRGVAGELTADTLAAIDEVEERYQAAIRFGRPGAPRPSPWPHCRTPGMLLPPGTGSCRSRSR